MQCNTTCTIAHTYKKHHNTIKPMPQYPLIVTSPLMTLDRQMRTA